MFIRDHAFSIFVPGMSAGVVGLTLTYAKMLTGGFQWCVRQTVPKLRIWYVVQNLFGNLCQY